MTDEDTDAPIEKSEAAERVRLKRASLRHLLDLKQAGHSPRFTELTVDPRSDRITAMPQPSRAKRGRTRRTRP